jgi:hypothetical protein
MRLYLLRYFYGRMISSPGRTDVIPAAFFARPTRNSTFFDTRRGRIRFRCHGRRRAGRWEAPRGVVYRAKNSSESPGRLPGDTPNPKGDGEDAQRGQKPGVSPLVEQKTANQRKSAYTQHQNAANLIHVQNPAQSSLFHAKGRDGGLTPGSEGSYRDG